MTNITARGVRGIGRRVALLIGATLALMLASLLAQPEAARAGNMSYPQETDLFMSGSAITLKILAGSQANTLVVNPTTFTVTVAAAEAFTVRYPGPNPGRLPNNGGLSECTLVSVNNEIVVTGPVTVTFTPNTTVCTGGGGGGGVGGGPSTVTLIQPNGGETLSMGQLYTVLWSYYGSATDAKLLLSTDGGVTYPTVTVTSTTNDGAHTWTVPSVTTTSTARLKIEVFYFGSLAASDTSNANFTIQGTAPPQPPPETPAQPPSGEPPATDPTATGTYGSTAALNATPTIDVDKATAPATVANCTAGSLIKLPNDNNSKTQHDAAVYYCSKNGKRYVFPNLGTYLSWYANFSTVTVVSMETMASIPLGGNVTYRPGKEMIKIQSDPKVYAVSRGGLLRWVTTEAIAVKLYGNDWNTKIDDVSDAFFVNYKMGDPITE